MRGLGPAAGAGRGSSVVLLLAAPLLPALFVVVANAFVLGPRLQLGT